NGTGDVIGARRGPEWRGPALAWGDGHAGGAKIGGTGFRFWHSLLSNDQDMGGPRRLIHRKQDRLADRDRQRGLEKIVRSHLNRIVASARSLALDYTASQERQEHHQEAQGC